MLSTPRFIRDYFDRHGLEGFERPRFFRKSPIGMTCAVFSEMDEDWVGPRWFGDDSIGRAVEGAKVNEPARAYEGTAAEHAARIIALVVADNPIPGRKAV